MMESWDDYWAGKEKIQNRVFDHIAQFYRIRIIKPVLRQYLLKYLSTGGIFLHAGCGSGQVEEGIALEGTVIGMDISKNALALYRGLHAGGKELILGDIRTMGLKEGSVDGIYNLGVMEHFLEPDIRLIFGEFHRVLKEGGRLIIFWPPRYGSSVLFLKGIQRLSRLLLGKTQSLHPPEPSLLPSREYMERLGAECGFRMVGYSFSWRDLYTYVVVVLKK